MAQDKSGWKQAKATDEFSEKAPTSGTPGPTGAPAPVAAEPPKRAKKPRTPIEERIAGMFRGERAQYYSIHLTSLEKQIEDLKKLVGPEAVELAEKEFLKK